MTVRKTGLLVLVTASFSLSGCASVFNFSWLHSNKPAQARSETPASAGTPMTDAGRKFLASGDTGLAIEAFQHALGSGEAAAPALNGLGVAYARLDRFETAQNLFAQAIALAPENEQYAANMARLLRSPALAMRHDADIAAQVVAVAAPAPETPAVAVKPAPGQLVRVSANEFHIVTASAAPAPQIGKASVRTARAKPAATSAAKSAPAKVAMQSARTRAKSALASKPQALVTPRRAARTTIDNPFVASAAAPVTTLKVEVRESAPAPKSEAGEADS
ncbi:tetratricopeptide repeat protein [Novosphingobium flavum]|uniref:Tetratricopeptide repeat protein n=1 Tax=Novosphingobium flavum TaxID=1778672 RepID=A0A7X1FSQ7_9SPHN|nr:tetratricopeptide repeat protein [Novosphingobium flavum]MBC2666288.1 tetratricopeptide repeat protein [Novosphingobium flavum]